jgi:Papain-like cysteine protease AvrRpt2
VSLIEASLIDVGPTGREPLTPRPATHPARTFALRLRTLLLRTTLGPEHLNGFQMEHQRVSRWCWAAVAVSIARFLKVPHPKTQCELANALLPPGNCCTEPLPADCDDVAGLVAGLGAAGVTAVHSSSQPTVPTIHADMRDGLPLGWRCEWDQLKHHFAVVVAIQPGAVTYVDVEDPTYGWTNAALRDLYEGRYLPDGAPDSGKWVDTYFTFRPHLLVLRLFGPLLRVQGGAR